jgi:hypothetical protein
MDIERKDVEAVFKILDEDGSGDVDYSEFVEQLHKMKNSDSHTLLIFIKHYVKCIHEELSDKMQTWQGEHEEMMDELHQMHGELRSDFALLQDEIASQTQAGRGAFDSRPTTSTIGPLSGGGGAELDGKATVQDGPSRTTSSATLQGEASSQQGQKAPTRSPTQSLQLSHHSHISHSSRVSRLAGACGGGAKGFFRSASDLAGAARATGFGRHGSRPGAAAGRTAVAGSAQDVTNQIEADLGELRKQVDAMLNAAFIDVTRVLGDESRRRLDQRQSSGDSDTSAGTLHKRTAADADPSSLAAQAEEVNFCI